MKEYKINVENLRSFCGTLKAGDRVLLSGTVYTARDAAHKRFMQTIAQCAELPIDIKDAVIYYAGPTPAPEGLPIGSCGPTTSSRMDAFAPKLLDMGLCAMIGKGPRSREVNEAIIRNRAVYLCAIGGAGALAAKSVKSLEVVAYDELGCESVKRLEVENFPLTVAIDCTGSSLFDR
ncbi:MAG: FumA C-terminus/TtdB family hydratase beta subunit [Clostridia bacterium]|nr:FumA C-terminus/TtdB family hydratase beta subunit [Clostridia bacterium]